MWLGEADPCETCKAIEANDPWRSELELVTSVWVVVFGRRALTLAEALTELEVATDGDDDADTLQNALIEVAGDDRGHVAPKRLAWWFRKVEGKIIGARKFVRASSTHSGVLRWQLVAVDDADPGHPGHQGYISAGRTKVAPRPRQQRTMTKLIDQAENDHDDYDDHVRRSRPSTLFDPSTLEGGEYIEAKKRRVKHAGRSKRNLPIRRRTSRH